MRGPCASLTLVLFFSLAPICHAALVPGDIYVSNYQTNSITQITPAGANSTFANSGMSWPYGMTFDSHGNLYVANEDNNTIRKFALDGTSALLPITGLNVPMDIVFDASDNLYVSNYEGDRVLKYTPSGVTSVFASVNAPRGMAFDSAGNFFVGTGLDAHVRKFFPDGSSELYLDFASGVHSLLIDSQDNLYVSNGNANEIWKYTPAKVGTKLGSLPQPQDMAFDADGNIFVASQNTNRLYKITPDGFTTIFSSTGMSGPTGVAIFVPEPTTIALGFLALTLLRRRRPVCATATVSQRR